MFTERSRSSSRPRSDEGDRGNETAFIKEVGSERYDAPTSGCMQWSVALFLHCENQYLGLSLSSEISQEIFLSILSIWNVKSTDMIH